MRRILLLLGLALCLAGCQSAHPIEGSWQGKDAEGHEATMYLYATGKFEALAKGESVDGTWVLNEELEPNRITLQVEGGESFTTIIKVQGDKMLLEPVAEEGAVPRAFSERATVYIRQP